MSTKPTPGQLLYRYRHWAGQEPAMEVVRFEKQDLAGPGCTMETWLVRSVDDGLRPKPAIGSAAWSFRCTIGSYYQTEREAYEVYLSELRSGLAGLQVQQQEVNNDICQAMAEIVAIKGILAGELETDIRPSTSPVGASDEHKHQRPAHSERSCGGRQSA